MKRALLATAAAAAIVIGVTHLFHVEAEGEAPLLRPIVVTGQGTASAVPDMASIDLGVIADGTTAAEALAKNNTTMTALFGTLASVGIAKEDIRTSNFSVSPQYRSDTPEGGGPYRIVGYQVQNSVQVKIRDIARLGEVLDRAVASGSNTINGISFGIDNADAVMSKARADAVADARKQAEELAASAGVSLGQVMSITTGSTTVPMPMYLGLDTFKAESVPTAPGTETLSVSVTITFAMN